MNAALSMFIPFEFNQFDSALEAVMNEEEQSLKRPSLADHPVYGMLLDSAVHLDTPNDYGVKMTTPVDHTPEVSIVTRIKAIAGFFNPELTAEQWQNAADHHPAAHFIQAELQSALNAGKVGDEDWKWTELAAVMDRLDEVGYMTAFDRSTNLFSITFKEAADNRIVDTQHDLKNKRLLDSINNVDPMENPKGGWADDKPTFSRSHPWKIQLLDPSTDGAYRFQLSDVSVAKPSFPRRSD